MPPKKRVSSSVALGGNSTAQQQSQTPNVDFASIRCRIEGRDWYPSDDIIKYLRLKGIRELQDKFVHATFFALTPSQRDNYVEAGILPTRPIGKCSTLLICSDDIDSYLKTSDSALSNDSSANVGGSTGAITSSELTQLPRALSQNDAGFSPIETSPAVHPNRSLIGYSPTALNRETNYFGSASSSPHVKLEPEENDTSEQSEHSSALTGVSVRLFCPRRTPPSSTKTARTVVSSPDDHQNSNNNKNNISKVACSSGFTATSDGSLADGDSPRNVFHTTPIKQRRTSCVLHPSSSDVKEEKRFICGSCPFFNEFPNEQVYLRHMDFTHLCNPTVVQAQNIELPQNCGSSEASSIQPQHPVFASPPASSSVVTAPAHRLSVSAAGCDTVIQKVSKSCELCSNRFSTEIDFRNHFFICVFESCGKFFCTGDELVDHVDSTHQNKVFICKTCFSTFRSRDGYGLHLKATCRGKDEAADLGVTSDRPQLQCQLQADNQTCGEMFSHLLNLFYHQRNEHGVTISAATASQAALNWTPVPVDSGQLGSVLRCRICKAFRNTSKETIFRHEFQHIGIDEFKCPKCTRTFTKCKSLRYHVRHTSHVLTFKCDYCEKRFRFEATRQRHIETFHTETGDSKPAVCDICQKACKNEIAVRIHKKLKHFQKQNSEDDDVKQEVKQPVISHLSNEINNIAAASSRPSTQPAFPCKICGQVLSQKRILRDHLDRHAGVKRYRCSGCKKSFTYASIYHTHVKQCNRSKGKGQNFSCLSCCDIFPSYRSLVLHCASMHPDTKTNCALCGDKFANKAEKRAHLESFHQMNWALTWYSMGPDNTRTSDDPSEVDQPGGDTECTSNLCSESRETSASQTNVEMEEGDNNVAIESLPPPLYHY